ncbi:MAG: hypothetical protein JWR26_1799 [Pedosphaera sp.]|nr:hypothetical protein [Pedosphaera sp.]
MQCGKLEHKYQGGLTTDPACGTGALQGKTAFQQARRRSEAMAGALQKKRSFSKAEARGGIWAAFGCPLGGQAANFVRAAPPKCLGVPRGTAFFSKVLSGSFHTGLQTATI